MLVICPLFFHERIKSVVVKSLSQVSAIYQVLLGKYSLDHARNVLANNNVCKSIIRRCSWKFTRCTEGLGVDPGAQHKQDRQ
jgi:hypothetical protein